MFASAHAHLHTHTRHVCIISDCFPKPSEDAHVLAFMSLTFVQCLQSNSFHYWHSRGRFHRLRLTPQLANPRLRDNRGLSSVSSIVISYPNCALNTWPDLVPLSRVSGCRGHVSGRSGHINYNNYCIAFDQRNGFGNAVLLLVRSKGIL